MSDLWKTRFQIYYENPDLLSSKTTWGNFYRGRHFWSGAIFGVVCVLEQGRNDAWNERRGARGVTKALRRLGWVSGSAGFSKKMNIFSIHFWKQIC